MEQVQVYRGRHAEQPLLGPLSGVRDGDVVAYDFELPSSFEPWPGRTRTERTYVLLDLGISFAKVCWVRWHNPDGDVVDRSAEGCDSWYVDLVTVKQVGDRYEFRDLYADVLVPTDGRHYRMLDLDELADAMDTGVLSIPDAIDGLRRWQRFLDGHLHTERAPSAYWSDFPPAAISSLVDLPAFEQAPPTSASSD
jgi:hypothetical protein